MTDLVDLAKLTRRDLQLKIVDRVVGVTLERPIDGAAQLTVSLLDTDRTITRSPVVTGAARILLGDLPWRLVEVRKAEGVDLTFEEELASRLRRATGFLEARAGTTRRSDFARRLVRDADRDATLRLERSPETTRQQIARGSEDEDDDPESSWDALGRLADEVGWRWFVDRGRAYFVSDDWFLANRNLKTARESTGMVDGISWDVDARKSADDATLTVRADPFVWNPGDPVEVSGEGPADGLWRIRSVTETAGTRQVTVELTRPASTLDEPEDD